MDLNRRKVLGMLAGLGIGSPIFNRALASMAQEDTPITAKMIQEAEWISGLELTDEQRDQAARALESARDNLTALREVKLTNDVGPAVHFRSLTPMASRTHEKLERAPAMVRTEPEPRPESDEEIAYLPVTQLASLIQRKLISSTELTKLYLRRIHKYNPLLNCVVQVTEDLAIKQAKQADQEIAAGKYRGPLHGIPWGAKDLISVPGYPTTWGAPQYREQELATQATVVQRLEEAGAVLVAKLTLGALAMGDKWFGGFTRCPWNYRVGSSGSSAGSASAVVAGLAGFTIGTETLGSIISPSRRCGATGLRPTFGRVSREGCMALAWSMDKVGPLARSVEDCALVLAAIHGADGKDFTAENFPFVWPPQKPLSTMTVGYTKTRKPFEEREDLQQLKELGVQLKEVKIPAGLPVRGLTAILEIEAAAAFDDLTRSNNVEGLNAWPAIFRKASLIAGVDYVRAMRVRSLLQEQFEILMRDVDILVNANDLVHTNLTGHPSIALPVGFRERLDVQMPYSTVFTGRLNQESNLLSLAMAFQGLQTAHFQRPPLDQQLEQLEEDNLAKPGPSEPDKN
jgi:Asp-tRNA(Asn)/Glu-tRNA(Gln) amidotransferase A subunit family amidase